MFRVFFLCFVIFLHLSASANEMLTESGIKTPAFTLSFPSGWRLQKKVAPIPLRGPNGALMLITPMMPDPEKPIPAEVPDVNVRDFWRGKIRDALTSATSQEGMRVSSAFTEENVQGMPFFSTGARNATEKSFLAAYGLIGKSGVVFIVTVEGWQRDEAGAKEAAEKMLKTVNWHSRN